MIVTAFVTGALARFAVPGPDPMPAWLTILIGLVGTLIGGGIVLATVGDDPAWVGHRRLLLGDRARPRRTAGSCRSGRSGGPEAYRFPKRGVGVDAVPGAASARRASTRTAIALAARAQPRAGAASAAPRASSPSQARTIRPRTRPTTCSCSRSCTTAACSSDDEYTAARTRLLERLRA